MGEEQLAEQLVYCDPMVLRAVIALLAPLDDPVQARLSAMPVALDNFFLVQLPVLSRPEDAAFVQDEAARRIAAFLSTDQPWPAMPVGRRLQALMGLALGDPMPADDVEFWYEELAVDPMPRRYRWDGGTTAEQRGQFRVLVIGAGYSGINAAIQLDDAGINFSVIEKNPGIGGVWYANHYPGARVDYPSRIYSYTYQADYRWEHNFAPQAEIKRYFEDIVDQYGIRDRFRFGEEVVAASWDDASQSWQVRIRSTDGDERTETANMVISAVGIFDRPSLPAFPGIDSFAGHRFHSALWDDAVDLAGKNVAIVGTGATALQIAASAAKVAKSTTVFQRSPAWLVEWPGVDALVPSGSQWMYDHAPWYMHFERLRTSYALGDRVLGKVFDVDPDWHHPVSINETNERLRVQLTAYLERKLAGRPDLIDKCLPSYPPIAKRFVVDAGWLDALMEERAEVVTDAIVGIQPDGIETADGIVHAADIICYATGFRSNDFLWPMDIKGRDGFTLEQMWAKDGGRAYLGMCMPGFPNFFLHYGPNSNPRAGTPPLWAEIQMRYICGVIEGMILGEIGAVAVHKEVFDEHCRRADEILARSVWMDPRQKSYYRNDFGRVATNSPWKTIDYWRWIRRPDLCDYECAPSKT